MFNLNTSINGIIINGFEIPVSIFALLISIYVYLLFKFIQTVKAKNNINKFKYNIVIKHNNKKYNIDGYLDTGNKTYDNDSPIIILGLKTFFNIFHNITYENLLLSKNIFSLLSNPHYIKVSSVNGTNKMLVFNIDEMDIYISNEIKTFKNVKMGLALKNFSDFDCLLHPDYF